MSLLPRVPLQVNTHGGLAGLGAAALASAIRSLGLGNALTQSDRLLQLRIGFEEVELDGALLICHADINEQSARTTACTCDCCA